MTNVIDLPRVQATKAVILARVSSKEQEEGHSIEAQKHRLNVYCQRRSLDILRVFEITESSTRGDRTKFMEMIKFCKAQRQPVAIVADKVDRVQRSFKEYPLLDALIQEGKIELHFNTEGYVIHRESVSQERLMWSFGVIMAQSYVDNLRDNVKRSIEHKIRSGEYVSRVPLGYLNVRENGRADVVVDDSRASLVLRLFTEYSTGLYTLGHITQQAKKWGLRVRSGKPVSRSQVHKIFNNPFYYGVMAVKGKQYPHRYPPLISKNLFDECQKVLESWHKKPFAYGKKEFVFRGILTCKTNGKTVSSFTKAKTFQHGGTKQWTYLQSWDKNGKLMYIREEKVLAQAEKALQSLVLPPEAVSAITDHLRDASHAEQDFLSRKTDELKKEDSRIQSRLTGLMELLMDKAITREEYDMRRAEFRIRQIEIANELAANRHGDDGFKDAMLLLLDLCNRALNLFAGSNVEEKRALLNFVFLNLALDEGTLCYSYRIPFAQFAEGVKSEKWSQLVEALRTTHDLRSAILEFVRIRGDLIRAFLSGVTPH